jgi:hypothetical protein
MDASAAEKRPGADQEGIRPIALKTGEGDIDFTAGAGVEDLDL